MADLEHCPACGGLTSGPRCSDCGAELPSSGAETPRPPKGRDETAESRDRAAELRDRGADDRDSRARRRAETTGRRGESVSDARRRDERSRITAAVDREDAAADRLQAARDREAAGRERAEAIRDTLRSEDAARRAIETIESMSDAFCTLDVNWRFTYVNPRGEELLQRPREELIGKVVWNEFPEAVGSVFEDRYRHAVREQVPVRFEERYAPLGGTFEVRAYPVADGLAVYFTDVTQERLRDARLKQTERLEMLGQVTAGVAHDFANVLAAVDAFTELGHGAATDETSRKYFGHIRSASENGRALTRQLLTFARAQTLEPVQLDLNDAVSALEPLLRQLLPFDVRLVLALSPEPVTVFVDRSQLDQVLLNLVVNSRDAIGATGTITVGTATTQPPGLVHDAHGAFGWLQVSDTGAGIPPDVQPYIFDPFFSTKPPGSGTGLGLATIHGIVYQSGGSIQVESAIGVGTTMTVALPAEAPVSDR